MEIKRGDVVEVSLDPVRGNEKGKTRPCVIVQNDIGNKISPTTIIVPITDSLEKKTYPFQVLIKNGTGGLTKDSKVCCEHVRIIDKSRIVGKRPLGHLEPNHIHQINKALRLSLGLP